MNYRITQPAVMAPTTHLRLPAPKSFMDLSDAQALPVEEVFGNLEQPSSAPIDVEAAKNRAGVVFFRFGSLPEEYHDFIRGQLSDGSASRISPELIRDTWEKGFRADMIKESAFLAQYIAEMIRYHDNRIKHANLYLEARYHEFPVDGETNIERAQRLDTVVLCDELSRAEKESYDQLCTAKITEISSALESPNIASSERKTLEFQRQFYGNLRDRSLTHVFQNNTFKSTGDILRAKLIPYAEMSFGKRRWHFEQLYTPDVFATQWWDSKDVVDLRSAYFSSFLRELQLERFVSFADSLYQHVLAPTMLRSSLLLSGDSRAALAVRPTKEEGEEMVYKDWQENTEYVAADHALGNVPMSGIEMIKVYQASGPDPAT